MRRTVSRKPQLRLTFLLAAWMSALSVSLAASPPASEAEAHERPAADAANGSPVVAALRANGARILALGERGGLDGHFVELADGDAYGLYLTPDGHAVAGLLYGPDGALLTGRQIEAARGGDAGAIRAAPQVSSATPAKVESVPRELRSDETALGGSVEFVHAHAADPTTANGETSRHVEALFEHSASAFGFTLGNAGPAVIVFADPGCRWSRAAVVRLVRLALDGRLRLRTIPVGVLGAASAREAAAIASVADPALAWFEGTAGPAIPEGGRRIERNNALFDAWGAGAVPLIAWRARDGGVAHRVGDIDDMEAWLGTLRHE